MGILKPINCQQYVYMGRIHIKAKFQTCFAEIETKCEKPFFNGNQTLRLHRIWTIRAIKNFWKAWNFITPLTTTLVLWTLLSKLPPVLGGGHVAKWTNLCRTTVPRNSHISLNLSALFQVMLIANPSGMPVSFKYVLSYLVDGEPQTDMGEVERLPI